MTEETTPTVETTETTPAETTVETTETKPSSILSSVKPTESEETVVADETAVDGDAVAEEESIIPETIDGYDFGERDLPEELINQEQMITMDGFKEFCLENKVPTDLAKKILAFHDSSASKAYEGIKESSKASEVEAEAELNTRIEGLKEDLGGQDNFEKAVNNVNNMLINKGFTDEELAKDGFNNSIIGIKLVNELLGRLGEDKVATDGKVLDNSSIDSQLDTLTRSDAYFDFGHKDHVSTLKKVNELQAKKLKLS